MVILVPYEDEYNDSCTPDHTIGKRIPIALSMRCLGRYLTNR